MKHKIQTNEGRITMAAIMITGGCWNFTTIGAYFHEMKSTPTSHIANGVTYLTLIGAILFCMCQDIGDHSHKHDLWGHMELDGQVHITTLLHIKRYLNHFR